jgi:hypothetical protein
MKLRATRAREFTVADMDELRRGLIRAEIAERMARARVDLEVAAELAFIDRRLADREDLRASLLELAGRLQDLQGIGARSVALVGDSQPS